jgi:predicted kinase
MKHVILLVGPKGSGKSTIGTLLETRLGIRFVRVEPIFLELRGILDPAHPEFERRGYEAVLSRLTAELNLVDTVCFETTGASRELEPALGELARVSTLLIVQVICDLDECKERIRGRDSSIHIPVSDDQVDRINAVASRVELPWAARIDNRGEFNPELIVNVVRRLLSDSPKGA